METCELKDFLKSGAKALYPFYTLSGDVQKKTNIPKELKMPFYLFKKKKKGYRKYQNCD